MLRRVSALPDPFDLLAIADRIAGHASATRDRARRLQQAVDGVDWHGLAADAFHAQAGAATGGLHSAAGRLDDAAAALRRHAARIGGLIEDAVRLGHDEWELVTDGVLHPGEVLGDVGDVLHDQVSLLGDVVGL
jgi:hypothetical protein